MITEKEIQAATLSPTKKDFYQIWNELLDTAGKISTVWNPSATNESDPGIVLLKVLTACTDKLNYNIDKNILEVFMPSATQEDSMRKLCDMLGYNIKYYRSATTTATISYVGDSTTLGTVTIPQFSTLTNADNTVNYITLEPLTLVIDNSETTTATTSGKVACIEGEYVQCTTNYDNNIIPLTLLDSNNRYYLPEAQIAENGVYIFNYNETSIDWVKVDNLNTYTTGSTVYKFGYDSKQGLPYIQFPDDISALIKDGLVIYYLRTSGSNGNISANTLSMLSGVPSGTSITASSGTEVATEDFAVNNASAATNGSNIETLNEAYNGFKKTIGTFDTLVTCRDYINKIYNLTEELTDNPLVSNVIVTDIRDDINKAFTLCEFSDSGIKYVATPKTTGAITNFDLVLYPFKTVYGENTKAEYLNSFKYSTSKNSEIEEQIAECKTISHKLTKPSDGEITCIKNYLKLNAKITTTKKVSSVEESAILANIYKAIYTDFNARHVDFGEEIPYDTILQAIENADERIKNVSLEEPELVTKIQVVSGTDVVEYSLDDSDPTNYCKLMNWLTLRNILSGNVKLFNYNTKFNREYTDKSYPGLTSSELPASGQHIITLEPSCSFSSVPSDLTLCEGEVLSFRAPNLKTDVTYPAYVNYYAHLLNSVSVSAVPAEFQTFSAYLYGRTTALTNISDAMMTDTEVAYSPKYVKSGTTYTKDDDGDYYVLLTTETFNSWYDWLCDQPSAQTNVNLTGLYRRLSSDRSRPVGELVDSNHCKYVKLNYLHVTTESALLSCYVQVTTATSNGLGVDATINSVSANADYVLQSGEYILLNYTKSTTSTDGTTSTSTVVNEYLPAGTVIRANFELKDSAGQKAQGVSYTKTSGYDFTKYPVTNPEGMYSFGTDEQLEQRSLSKVELYTSSTNSRVANVYWELNENTESGLSDKLVFPFDSDGKYILKENEYFYYTDANKLSMAWYGYGSEIQRVGTWELKKEELADKLSTINLNTIPWVTLYDLSANKNIVIQEYQYVNLTAGDTLNSISGISSINKTYADCTGASYTLSDGTVDTIVPFGGNASSLGLKWQVRSKLELDVGPDKKQTLYKTRDQIKYIYYIDGSSTTYSATLQPSSDSNPLSIKTNYTLAASQDSVSVKVTVYADDGSVLEHKDDFSINAFVYSAVTSGTTPVSLNNYSGVWTKAAVDDLNEATLNINIPQNHFGLIMFYYETTAASDAGTEELAYLTTQDSSENPVALSIYNYRTSGTVGDTWWAGKAADDKYYLRGGINIVKIPNNCVQLSIYKGTSGSAADILTFGALDVIPTENELNTDELVYYRITESTVLEQLKSDIRALDTSNNFYYNTIMDNSIILDMNTDMDENIASPRTFYNYNNVNNGFVISEISVEAMKSGITIARSSKL